MHYLPVSHIETHKSFSGGWLYKLMASAGFPSHEFKKTLYLDGFSNLVLFLSYKGVLGWGGSEGYIYNTVSETKAQKLQGRRCRTILSTREPKKSAVRLCLLYMIWKFYP